MKNQITSQASKLVIKKKVIKNYTTTRDHKENPTTVSVSSSLF